MNAETILADPDRSVASPARQRCDLFSISLLILFLELACIRWFPAHVLFLTFFTNAVLLACFLGMSIGCLAAGHRRNYLIWTPCLLAFALGAGQLVVLARVHLQRVLDVGHQASPQLVFFGTEEKFAGGVDHFVIPIEVLTGFFFLLIALSFVGLGQELGRALNRQDNRVLAYTLNILGSLAGIVLFAALSWLELPPFWWFLPIVAGIGYFLVPYLRAGRRDRWALPAVALAAALALASLRSGTYQLTTQEEEVPLWRVVEGATQGEVLACQVQPGEAVQPDQPIMTVKTDQDEKQILAPVAGTIKALRPPGARVTGADPLLTLEVSGRGQHLWSPYYRIDYEEPPRRAISVNLIGHQQMVGRTSAVASAYHLPYLLQRDAQRLAGREPKPVDDVLIIGAGSGNDVSRALQWGVKHVDAVEIDPVIQRLGTRDHPDHPYQDERVTVYLDDGRNFLRATDRQYDLIVYALVDSLILHSSYSNIRLESYLFTRQAFADVQRHLKPGGLFVMYNFFRQGWIVARLSKGVAEVFDTEPLVLRLPYQETIQPEEKAEGITALFVGKDPDLRPLRAAFDTHPAYWLRGDRPPGPASPNGFQQQPAPGEQGRWERFGPARVEQPEESLLTASDDWPFLYLRKRMIPTLSLRGAAIMAGLALLLLYCFSPRRAARPRWAFDGRMFFLGAGFMLVETKAVVNMALLFGSTWMVNSVVFFAVLVMILAANLFVLKFRPERLWPNYAGLLAALALNCAIPLDYFLGMERAVQVLASCLLVFAPIAFAGVIFAVSFGRSHEPDRAFGTNIAGAMLGGLAEYTSMLLGFQYLVLVAVGFYALSAVLGRNGRGAAEDRTLVPEPAISLAGESGR
jgi:SAM-dependent methyltransferase